MRVARRYILLGEHWCDDQHTPPRELLSVLPYDIHKLEWLCKLPIEKLKMLNETADLRERSRGEVITSVKRMLGMTNLQIHPEQEALKPLKQLWQHSIERLLDGIEDLTAVQRQQLAEDIETKAAQLMDALQVPDVQSPDEALDSDELIDEN
jgi:hypothetical protein